MTQPAEQFLNTAKTSLADAHDIAETALSGFEKLVDLNMSAAKAMLQGGAEQMQGLLAIKSPQDLAGLNSLAQPMAEQAVAYGRAVMGIATETGTALGKAVERQFSDVQAQSAAALDAALKMAPAGSEGAVTALKSAIDAGQNALQSVQGTAKQAMAAAEKNMAAAADMAVSAAKTASKGK